MKKQQKNIVIKKKDQKKETKKNQNISVSSEFYQIIRDKLEISIYSVHNHIQHN